MQQDKQPDYHPVVFRDRAAGYAFLTRSTATRPHIEKNSVSKASSTNKAAATGRPDQRTARPRRMSR